MKFVIQKSTGDNICNLPKQITLNNQLGILIIDIENKVWFITNTNAEDVTSQFSIVIPDEDFKITL